MMDEKPDQVTTPTTDDFPSLTFWIVLGVFMFAAAVVCVYVYKFGPGLRFPSLFDFKNWELSADKATWGAFGDYVGGLVNPAVGLATVFLVFLTLIVQRKELKASLTELKAANESTARMSFEQSLFAWLANYHSLLNVIEASTPSSTSSGRKALHCWYKSVLAPEKTFDYGRAFYIAGNLATNAEANEAFIRYDTPNEGIQQLGLRLKYAVIKFQQLYWDNRSDLDAPFRTLFRLIRWIDESDLTTPQKWHYVALVRSQLSWIEQVFLFYNCLTKEGIKLALYANRYALFDNLVGGDELIRFASKKFTDQPAADRPSVLDGAGDWPYLPSAFSSGIAKKALGLPDST